MVLIWALTLVIYGAVYGFGEIPGLAWWLCLTFGLQDAWDLDNKKRR